MTDEWGINDINVQPTPRRKGWRLLLLMSWDALWGRRHG